jgi:transposase
LVRFLDDPRIPLDSNHVERALRAIAVGRKNHYGSRSERGTRVAALLYSLIESAKLCGVEPRAYLREATLRAVRNPGTATLARDLKASES